MPTPELLTAIAVLLCVECRPRRLFDTGRRAFKSAFSTSAVYRHQARWRRPSELLETSRASRQADIRITWILILITNFRPGRTSSARRGGSLSDATRDGRPDAKKRLRTHRSWSASAFSIGSPEPSKPCRSTTRAGILGRHQINKPATGSSGPFGDGPGPMLPRVRTARSGTQ